MNLGVRGLGCELDLNLGLGCLYRAKGLGFRVLEKGLGFGVSRSRRVWLRSRGLMSGLLATSVSSHCLLRNKPVDRPK